ncbi:MAG TPA: hypothetical protein VGM74_00575, partial [Burkholderiaceae bacterium]
MTAGLQSFGRRLDRIEANALAIDALVLALCEVLTADTLPIVQAFFQTEIAGLRHQLTLSGATPAMIESFDSNADRLSARLLLVRDD